MRTTPSIQQISRQIVQGLAERYLNQVGPLCYDGEELLADDVVELMLPSMLVYSRELFYQLGLISSASGFPASFHVTDEPGMSPLQANFSGEENSKLPMVALAAVLVEIFEVDLVSYRNDLSQFMQSAGQLVGLSLAPSHDPIYASRAESYVPSAGLLG